MEAQINDELQKTSTLSFDPSTGSGTSGPGIIGGRQRAVGKPSVI